MVARPAPATPWRIGAGMPRRGGRRAAYRPEGRWGRAAGRPLARPRTRGGTRGRPCHPRGTARCRGTAATGRQRAALRRLVRAAGQLTDRQRPCRLRPQSPHRGLHRRRRFTGPVGVRPDPPIRACHGPVPGGLALGGRRFHRSAGRGPSRAAVARARGVVARRASRARTGLLRDPRTARDVPAGARDRTAPSTGGHRPAWALARRRVDRDGLARDDGGCGAKRRGGGGRCARPPRAGPVLRCGGRVEMTITLPSLSRTRGAVTQALRTALEQLDETSRMQAGYHFGWTDRDGQPTGGNGGKAVRPSLALLSAEAAGAPAEAGMPGAVAVELVHNFSLLHDDLMDRSE